MKDWRKCDLEPPRIGSDDDDWPNIWLVLSIVGAELALLAVVLVSVLLVVEVTL